MLVDITSLTISPPFLRAFCPRVLIRELVKLSSSPGSRGWNPASFLESAGSQIPQTLLCRAVRTRDVAPWLGGRQAGCDDPRGTCSLSVPRH